jgi:hypothetical protein
MTRVFSFCLYGPENPLYYEGMIENIRIIQEYFPDWKIFVYVSPDVTPRMLERLRTHPQVVLHYTGEYGAINMIHRFYAIDEPDVEIMMCRDADSRVHWKDRWAIQEFLKSSYLAHTIRDNIEHTATMMGGLWGMRKIPGISLYDLHEEFKANPVNWGVGYDQSFLNDKLYPRVVDIILAHYSFDRCRFAREHAELFPFDWKNETYCGRVEVIEPKRAGWTSTTTLTPGAFTNILRKK